MGHGQGFLKKKDQYLWWEEGERLIWTTGWTTLHYTMQLMLPRHILPSLHVAVSRTVWLHFIRIIEITSGVSVFHTYRSLNSYKHWAPRLKSLRVHVLPENVSHIIRSETDNEEPKILPKRRRVFTQLSVPFVRVLGVCWRAMLLEANRFVKTDTQYSDLPLLQELRMHARKKRMPFLLFICLLHGNATRSPRTLRPQMDPKRGKLLLGLLSRLSGIPLSPF